MRDSNEPGEPATFEDWYAEHGTFVLRIVGFLGVTGPEQADVVQEVWIDVYRSLPLFDPSRARPRAWLWGIAHNAVRDWRRTRRRRPEITRCTTEDPLDSAQLGPEVHAAKAGRMRALLAFVERAVPSEDQRTALLLHEIEGWTVEEVAQATGVKVWTAQWRIKMARSRLKAAQQALTEEERERMRAVILPLGGVDGIVRALRECQPEVSDDELAEVWDRVVERIEAEGGSIHDRAGAQPTLPEPPAPRTITFTGPGLAGTVAGVFAVGALSGALAHAWLTARPTPTGRTTIDAEIRPTPPPTAEPRPEPTAPPSAVPSPRATAARALSISPEVWLLERAQKAEPIGALQLADQHAARYPRSTRADEREEIAIRALSKLGRRDEAEARAERLVQWAPWMAPRMEELLGGSFL